MSNKLYKRGADQALLMAVVFGAGLLAQWQTPARAAEDVEVEVEGRIVEISPAGGESDNALRETPQAPAPAYWIGVAGQEITNPVLQTQFQLAADTGVIVGEVVPGSPAEQAGLRQHDIILAVNGDVAHGMTELVAAVRSGGGEPIELKILRLAKEERISVTPTERPADFTASLPAGQQAPGLGAELNDLNRRLQGLLVAPNGNRIRIVGPGMIVEQRRPAGIPAGVSVAITRQNDGPAQVTVSRGDESWTVTEGDEEAMAQLPEDLRPMVQQMLGRPSRVGGMNFNLDLNEVRELLPGEMGDLGGGPQLQAARERAQAAAERARERMEQMRQRTEASRQELMKRMEEMERRMQDLQQRLGAPPAPAPPATPVPDNQTT